MKLRCCAQIGTEDDAFKALQLGTVDAYIVSQNNVSPHWPLMDVFVLPYMFQSTDHLVAGGAAVPSATHIRQAVAGGNERPPADLRRAELPRLLQLRAADQDHRRHGRPEDSRAQERGDACDLFEAFGAEPVPLAWSETPTALQTGTIDGGDNGTNVIQEMKFYEFAPLSDDPGPLRRLLAAAGFGPVHDAA